MVGGHTGSAEVTLPLRVDLEQGKRFVRDGEGRAQGVIEAKFASVRWDRSALEQVR